MLLRLPLYVFISCLCLVVLLNISCSKNEPALSQLDSVLSRGELVVLTSAGPTTYHNRANINGGFEFELASLFAQSLGIKARFIVSNDFSQLFLQLEEQQADFIAAGLSITPKRQQSLLFTPPYYQVTQQLIYHHRNRRPRNINQLTGLFFDVVSNTSHAETLTHLSQKNPQLNWNSIDKASVAELIGMVNSGLLDYTIADSNQFQLLRGQYPMLASAFAIAKPEDIAWAFRQSGDLSLYNKAVSFLETIKANGKLLQLQDKYFGYSKTLNYVGICTYKRHIKTRLPALRPHFQAAAAEYQLDWKLLAAVAYQESHWSKEAVSPTGVRGIMMLTQATAKQLAVKDRLDPEQSIDGGARYLSSRLQSLPARIQDPDKTWMAMAAYNIGLGHLEDARVLTQIQGANPDRWVEVKQRLPLLTQKIWYEKTKHGYARGYEPVSYVENIRHYYNTLQRLFSEASNNNPLPADKAFDISLPAL